MNWQILCKKERHEFLLEPVLRRSVAQRNATVQLKLSWTWLVPEKQASAGKARF